MMRRGLTDEQIGDALLWHETGAPERSSCVHEDRLWDLARGALDPDETGRILDHALECADCSLALRVARETFAVSPVTSGIPAVPGSIAKLWDRLAASVLRPAPALVYLVLLLASFPLYRVLTPSKPALVPTGAPESPTPPAPAPPAAPSGLQSLRIVRLTGDLSLRGVASPSTPLRVHVGEAEALVLKLFPEVEDLPKDPGATLHVRVVDGETVVAEATRRVRDLETDQSLSFLLDRVLLRPGTTYHVELTAEASATASPILRQSFQLDPE